MKWLRGIIFTLLVPAVIAGWVPYGMSRGAALRGGVWDLGWVVVGLGAAIYLLCFLGFLAAGGTPAIFFTRHLGFLIGNEPSKLVSGGLYRLSRNPMYLGVLLAIFGQAVLFASPQIALYGLAVGLLFHLTVVLLEEPHLRRERADYDDYCRRVPRWFGIPR